MQAIHNGKRYELIENVGVSKMILCNAVNMPPPPARVGERLPPACYFVDDAGSVQVDERFLTVRAYRSKGLLFAVAHDCKHEFFHRSFSMMEVK